MTTEPVEVAREGGVAIVTLTNRPVGALSEVLVADLREAVLGLQQDDANVVVIRSGVPGYFGVGADLKLLERVNVHGFMTYLEQVRDAIDAIAGLGRVTIAAIDGLALGGGFELALACTFRIAGPEARLGLPEVKLGLLPGAGGTQRLTRLVRRDIALDLLLSGRQVGAHEAFDLGLVTRVASERAADEAAEWARSLAGQPHDATRAILRCANTAAVPADPGGLAVEAEEIYRLFRSDAATRAISEFVQRRSSNEEART